MGLAELPPPAAPHVQLDDDHISTRAPHLRTKADTGDLVALLLLTARIRYGAELKKQGKDAAKEFEALDVDGSGGLSAEELQQFKQLRAVGTVDV